MYSAIKSPQLLELSGIGDPKVLNALGIEVKAALPAVGNNSQEHNFVGLSWGERLLLNPLHHLLIGTWTIEQRSTSRRSTARWTLYATQRTSMHSSRSSASLSPSLSNFYGYG